MQVLIQLELLCMHVDFHRKRSGMHGVLEFDQRSVCLELPGRDLTDGYYSEP